MTEPSEYQIWKSKAQILKRKISADHCFIILSKKKLTTDELISDAKNDAVAVVKHSIRVCDVPLRI
jgi:hypothetical protein